MVSTNCCCRTTRALTAEVVDVAQVSALLTTGLVGFLAPTHHPIIVPWLADLGRTTRL